MTTKTTTSTSAKAKEAFRNGTGPSVIVMTSSPHLMKQRRQQRQQPQPLPRPMRTLEAARVLLSSQRLLVTSQLMSVIWLNIVTVSIIDPLIIHSDLSNYIWGIALAFDLRSNEDPLFFYTTILCHSQTSTNFGGRWKIFCLHFTNWWEAQPWGARRRPGLPEFWCQTVTYPLMEIF